MSHGSLAPRLRDAGLEIARIAAHTQRGLTNHEKLQPPAAQGSIARARHCDARVDTGIRRWRHCRNNRHGSTRGKAGRRAWSTELPRSESCTRVGKYGKADVIFAPDPAKQKNDSGTKYDYVRPLATIEPTAIYFGLPGHHIGIAGVLNCSGCAIARRRVKEDTGDSSSRGAPSVPEAFNVSPRKTSLHNLGC